MNNPDFSKDYPPSEYSKTIYDFTREQQHGIISLYTIIQLAQLANLRVNQIIQSDCFKKFGIKNSQDIAVEYNTSLGQSGQFIVYSPRNWCALCTNRKGINDFQGKLYCDGCMELVKNLDVPSTKKSPK